jgi:NNP family nitrate/nitrite transporter-like MFS transporter
VFRAKARRLAESGVDPAVSDREARWLSGALIGIAGAIGAFGGWARGSVRRLREPTG